MSIQFASNQPDTDTPHESLKPDSSGKHAIQTRRHLPSIVQEGSTAFARQCQSWDGTVQQSTRLGPSRDIDPIGWRDLSRPCSIWLAPSAPSACLALPLLSQNSKADECTERLSFPFAECAERLAFSLMAEAQDGVSRPLVGLLDAQLLAACCRSTCKQATACQNGNQGIHSPLPCSGQTCQWMAGAKGESPWDNQPNSTGQDNRPPTSVRSHGVFVVVDGPRSVPCRPSGRSHPPIREQLPNWQPFPLVTLRREEVYDASASAYDFPVPEIHSLAFIYGCCSAGRKVAFSPCIGGSVFGTIQALSCEG